MMLQIVLSCERIVTLAVCKRFIVEFSQILKKNVNENILFYVFGCVKSIHLRLSLGLLCIFVIAIPVTVTFHLFISTSYSRRQNNSWESYCSDCSQ